MITYSEKAETEKLSLPIYLDNQSTTATDPQVLETMLPFFTTKPGNPHSDGHQYGQEAMEAVEISREKVAAIIAADPREIIFTSGATESNNLALKGAATFYGKRRKRIITAQTEHKCVIETCKRLEASGYEVIFLPVKETGILDFEALDASVNEDTLIVSIMAAHNEIGVLQEITAIGELCKKRGALFHTDAAQAIGKIPLDVQAMNIDLMSISGHKIYGPKGIGILYVKKPENFSSLIIGGGQEKNLRAGTENISAIAGMGLAAETITNSMDKKSSSLIKFEQQLKNGLNRFFINTIYNGNQSKKLPGLVNISFPGNKSGIIMKKLDRANIALSNGSACGSGDIKPSPILSSIGLDDSINLSTLRFSFGSSNTSQQVDYLLNELESILIEK